MALQKLRVAVLRGGPSPEYEVSLKTGENVLSLLRTDENMYEPVDIFIDKAGIWHYRGLPHEPHQVLKHIDVAWNAMHGTYGEDGQVQKILSFHKVPYTGAEAIPSALAMQKDMAKAAYKKHGLLTPEHIIIEEADDYEAELLYVFRNFLHPVVVKPVASGSSLGTTIAHTWDELKEAVKSAFTHGKRVLVEEYIRGKEATAGVIEGFRGEKLYALIPVEIVKPGKLPIFYYDAKYSGEAKEQCPGSFSREENRQIEDAARRAHEILGLRHYSRSDFMITPKGKIYILETNSLPGFTRESLFPKALKATGIKDKEFVDHLINLAIKK